MVLSPDAGESGKDDEPANHIVIISDLLKSTSRPDLNKQRLLP